MKYTIPPDIDPGHIPAHVAIIMDGNGRWAEKKSLPRAMGHRRGAEILEPVIDAAIDLGIKVLSLYAFSVENWARPREEIRVLWSLLEYFFNINIAKMRERNIRIVHSGFLEGLPASTAGILRQAMDETRKNTGLTVNFCINYGGRQEIVDGVNRWLERRKDGERLTEKKMAKHLFAPELPDVDLLIRTSGESRLSNFLLWRISYAELYFTPVLWPDFRPRHLCGAVLEYQKRERRFGGI